MNNDLYLLQHNKSYLTAQAIYLFKETNLYYSLTPQRKLKYFSQWKVCILRALEPPGPDQYQAQVEFSGNMLHEFAAPLQGAILFRFYCQNSRS